MSEELSTPFLALGSVIRLNEGIHGAMLFFIVARAIAKNNDGKIISRYKVAPHPFGDVPTENVFSIRHDEISEVVFEGYTNEIDNKFLESLITKMTNAKDIPVAQPTAQVVAPNESEEIVDEKEKLKKDPFYKFRK
ncbi:DUF4176 domain-containing protein [Enterococcus faecalis]|jgi:hypothetical protein|uniref:DUF4176 domain-containing protein n=1 Tax=Enterococcus TaxID=1350 RepID=UPI00045B4447|nr:MULTISPECIES: DUF4176 domain-containing protein [Enterococcus]HEM8038985.1 DUF4176 domain-containing protein [Klebsiella aerogenes]EGO2826332.1 DUF4176 domain-containing protein [Enterococcus faecalis]EGO7552732.1 DUF4176 domain-containing protein [Enterococcus faecalis]EGO9397182.1 DUF4176 domain-containing protein [Enterococcus faecalis]EGS7941931.1 DUF4176 domain-containing protein [Enterococcus faecalis]